MKSLDRLQTVKQVEDDFVAKPLDASVEADWSDSLQLSY